MSNPARFNRRLRIFTWHVHSNYLLYLTQANCDFYLPTRDDPRDGYGGKTKNFPFGDTVHEVPVNEVKNLDFDIILFQDDRHYLEDQYWLFSDTQKQLPKIYIEHDPPREDPVAMKHIVDDPKMLLVHVTHFNRLMWDNNRTPTTVIEHGVLVPDGVTYSGNIAKGIVMANNISSIKRGQRRMGYDIFRYVSQHVPLDIIGMGSKEIGGLGEIPYKNVASFLSHYRFFFNPIRYTSLGLSVCEAMTAGVPIVGVGTTELPEVIANDMSGFVSTNVDFLIEKMKLLLARPQEAIRLSKGAKKAAEKRFSIQRFARDWEHTFITFLQSFT
jgi:glycosyltransferase involved in cell wall biosynthesis